MLRKAGHAPGHRTVASVLALSLMLVLLLLIKQGGVRQFVSFRNDNLAWLSDLESEGGTKASESKSCIGLLSIAS